MADMLGGMTASISGFFGGVGGGFTQGLIMIQLPLMLVWAILTVVIVWAFFFRKMVVVNPLWPLTAVISKIPIAKKWVATPWRFNVTLISPYASMKTEIRKDIGALASEDGIRRFKLKSDGTVMQKPDSTDIYPNGEIPIVSLGIASKLMAKRFINYVKKEIVIDIENPQIASLYSADRVAATDPDWLLNKFREMSLLIVLWMMASVSMMMSNLLVFYPYIAKSVFWGP